MKYMKMFDDEKYPILDTDHKIDDPRIFTHSSNEPVRLRFVIPVGSLYSKKWWQFWKKDESKKAREAIASLISDYKEDIDWDNTKGEIKLNTNPIKEEYWVPVKNGGFDNGKSHMLYE